MRKKRLVSSIALAATAACGAPGTPSDSGAGSGSHSGSGPRADLRSGPRSDFDGDGMGDLVITDTSATVNGTYAAGYAAVVRGSADGPVPARHQVITQDSLGLGNAGTGGRFGRHATSGDLDGDGRSDLITQAGSRTVFIVWADRETLAGAVRLTGAAPHVGDFDGDGHTDLVTSEGPSTATIRFGPFNRVGKPSRVKSVDLTTDDPAYYTASLVGVGDVTGDGRDDLVVTWSHVYADEMPTPRATVLYRGTADGGLTKGSRLKDARGKDMFGSSVTTADVNKDGFADVVVGLPCEIVGEETRPAGGSRLMVAYGGAAGQSSGLKATTINDSTPGLPGSPVSTSCGFGDSATAGDVNGDGYADIAFTAPTEDGESAVLVLRGGPGGLTGQGAQQAASFPGTPRLALLDMNGDQAADLAIGTLFPGVGDGKVRILRGGPSGVDPAGPTLIGPADLGLTPRPGDGFGSDFGH
ncbi:FG-GAP and VCBS repeat-containing protein [Streptomyces sp. NPDC058405]|uniref:FG-GAP and VCBS repeat-containing protein n=1 Tax=Streptomyces sp. NPDC058405 TaxID=3346482 RepID=UPI0036481080